MAVIPVVFISQLIIFTSFHEIQKKESIAVELTIICFPMFILLSKIMWYAVRCISLEGFLRYWEQLWLSSNNDNWGTPGPFQDKKDLFFTIFIFIYFESFLQAFTIHFKNNWNNLKNYDYKNIRLSLKIFFYMFACIISYLSIFILSQ